MKHALAGLWIATANTGSGPLLPPPTPVEAGIGAPSPAAQNATHVDIIVPSDRALDLNNVRAQNAGRCLALTRNETLYNKSNTLGLCYNGPNLVETFECTYSGTENGSFMKADCVAIDFHMEGPDNGTP